MKTTRHTSHQSGVAGKQITRNRESGALASVLLYLKKNGLSCLYRHVKPDLTVK